LKGNVNPNMNFRLAPFINTVLLMVINRRFYASYRQILRTAADNMPAIAKKLNFGLP